MKGKRALLIAAGAALLSVPVGAEVAQADSGTYP